MKAKIIISIFLIEYIVAVGMSAILGRTSYFSTIPAIPTIPPAGSGLDWLVAIGNLLIFLINSLILVIFITGFSLPDMGIISGIFIVGDIIILICLIPII